ncbi:GLPGLI family protein [Salegentibacter sp. Hel_I_6]|uniref:GLPGLI family protein n=1 Tax=Salegentibacter sp. Hel_I_6 TaxID=1250278 RepID=UPI000689E9FF|nr:GLPGLI family protein [Salegentibacter sp. Hel_I_6]
MKKIILLVLLFSTPLFAQQTGTATYKKKADFQSTQSNSTTKSKNMNERLQKSIKELEYQLLFNETESVFFIKENLKHSSNQWVGLANTMGNGTGIKYLDFRKGERIQKKEFGGKTFLITENLEDLKWKITKESKIMDGYEVFKAITKAIQPGSSKNQPVDITAWFTPQISINSGPVGYGGLPGLIVELTIDNIFTYYLTEINFEAIEDIKKPTKGEVVTIKEYNKAGSTMSSK